MAVESKTKNIGWQAADFDLPASQGGRTKLSDFTDKLGLLVLFSCNHCPYAKAAWPLVLDLHEKFGGKIAFVAVNPNDEKTYPEDSFEVMKEKVKEWNITFPYLHDEFQVVAKAYKAQCTPDPYLFKNNFGKFKLYYHGRINDNWQEPEKVKEKNLEQAIEALLEGSPASQYQPPSIGCSIKWK